MRVSIPVEAGNRAIKDGVFERVLGATIERLRPEATYFYPDHGHRTCLMVFDLKSPSDLPTISERFFTELNASVEMYPVMDLEDLKTGLKSMAAHGAAPKG
jgi:hypothetical protein